MNANFVQARDMIVKSREAMRRGDKVTARMLGEQAALLVPDMEDAWLILAASDPNREDALAYAKRAREINPHSTRARKGVDWAEGRLNQAQGRSARVEFSRNQSVVASPIKFESIKPDPPADSKPRIPRDRLLLFGGIFALLTCLVFIFAAWSAASSPAFAEIVERAPVPTQENLWAQVNIPKPLVTSLEVSEF